MAYDRVRKISAVNGFVVIRPKGEEDITITVEEALDRAEAIRGMTTENEFNHNTTKEMLKELMEAILAARRQQKALLDAGYYVEFALKREHVRALEIYKATRAIRG